MQVNDAEVQFKKFSSKIIFLQIRQTFEVRLTRRLAALNLALDLIREIHNHFEVTDTEKEIRQIFCFILLFSTLFIFLKKKRNHRIFSEINTEEK